jgi:branched-chain amino acid transport system substrate-binding protein
LKARPRRWALALALLGGGWGGAAAADDTVAIGALYPLSGGDARMGAEAKAAIETGEDIVNTPHQGLETLPLGAGAGLPGLGGAKIAVIFGDHQDNPSVATGQVLRLKGHVAALFGAGVAAPTLAATAEAERDGIPFLVPDAMAPQITARGFKFVFRTTPLGGDFARVYGQFLAGLRAGGTKTGTVALMFENTARGTAAAAAMQQVAKGFGLDIVAAIAYPPDGVDLSGQVTALRGLNPDAVFLVGDAADAALFVKTMNTLGYRPPLLIGDDAGFSDPAFVAANGNLAQGLIDRSVWSAGEADSPAAIVNALYRAKTGRDLDDTGARVLQGFLVLAEAIDRARSTDPKAIQAALQQTDLRPAQLIVGYDGVKFDASGQNALASTYLVQLQGKRYVTVWPVANAPAKLVLPYKAWQ